MNDTIALELIKNGGRLYTKTILNNKELQTYLNSRFSDIPENMFTYKEVLYRIEHQIEQRPVCRVCGKPVSFIGDVPNKSIDGFRMTCSHKCHGLDKIWVNKFLSTNSNKSDEIKQKEKEKRENTNLERYGNKNIFIVKKEQIKNTMFDRYGGYTLQSNKLKEKVKLTNLEKYGVDNVFKAEEIKDKIKHTNLERYGTENYLQTPEGKMKMSTISKANHEKRKQTNLEKYGCEYAINNKDVHEKRLKSLKRNNTFNSSKIEKLFKEYLEINYCGDFEYQYKSNTYPFNCDFYIKSLDLYIEIQGSWVHGGHPYDDSKQCDMNQLNEMKLKNTKYYDIAIDIWTNRDVKKRMIAKQNNLNYLEIFSTNIDLCIYELNNFINNMYNNKL